MQSGGDDGPQVPAGALPRTPPGGVASWTSTKGFALGTQCASVHLAVAAERLGRA